MTPPSTTTTIGAPSTNGRPITKPPSSSSSAGGALGWLRTREGKITAGAAAVILVLALALRKHAGAAPAGFTADQLQTGPDGTIQSQLDEITGRGGTLDELTGVVTGLAGSAEQIRDLLEAQNPANNPAPVAPPGKIPRLVFSSNTQDISARWAPVSGAAKYLVEWIAGKDRVIRSATVTDPYARFGGGLRAGAPYAVRVTPISASGTRGPAIRDVYRTRAK